MLSAEGAVQNLKYTATFPLLLNIESQPTYFMALKDAAGLVKKFAMVNIDSYQYVAVGDTVAQCQQAYVELLATNGVLSSEQAAAATVIENAEQAGGVIATMTQAVLDGNSHFYVTFEGDDAIYDFALPDMIAIVTYREGDEVEFSYVETEGYTVRTAVAFAGDDAQIGTAFADVSGSETEGAGTEEAADSSDAAAEVTDAA